LKGMKPYIYSIIPFAASRPYEQIKVDVAYMNTNVKIVGVGAGFAYGPAGATHHALDDIAIMRTLPNMTIVVPGAVNEAENW
ncbi:MAG: transketolase, partial [Mailhella sp.]|nr:transketolase [Mailhella sp.]